MILSDQEVMEFYGHEPHQSLDDTQTLIEQIQTRYVRREAIRWGITLQGEKRLVGSCSFHHFDSGFHCVEIGYELNRAFWGAGHYSRSSVSHLDLWVYRTGVASC
ncbi:MAG TPA: GNAT family N-acetyltransferase [Ktedonobacteraceae bacterium]|nr:GNAT family N-acetyltransferase [Ktedonobacteraceae bacterium]